MSFEDLEAGKPLASVSKMQDPSQAVAVGVFQIHTAVSTFQRLVNTLGTPRDTLDLRGRLNILFARQEEFPNAIDLRESYRAVGRDLLKLLFFVEMNAIGLRKILKKFDKRVGYRFTNYDVKTRATHPYSQLQQVFKHVAFGAVVGAITRNLNDLPDHQGSYMSIYDHPVLALQDPVIISLKAAVDRLTHSTNFLQYYGTTCITFGRRSAQTRGRGYS